MSEVIKAKNTVWDQAVGRNWCQEVVGEGKNEGKQEKKRKEKKRKEKKKKKKKNKQGRDNEK